LIRARPSNLLRASESLPGVAKVDVLDGGGLAELGVRQAAHEAAVVAGGGVRAGVQWSDE
jgi:hypothetical protein